MRLSEVRWGRGFFRLWLVLATIWLLVVTGFTVSPFLSPYTPTKHVAFQRDSKDLVLIDPWGEPFNSLETAVREGRFAFYVVGPESRLYLRKDEEGSATLVDRAAALIGAEDARARDQSRIRTGLTWFWLGIFWPLVLLAIGAAIGWAISGFRNQRA